ncbi:DUF2971 domain-containing protein [Enterobacter sp. MW07]|nr:DUF2971 domain-containing protein [Enterobacter sp. MW07]
MGVFHYTDLNGFKGIVEGNTLWATNIHHLNDSKEYHHGIKCFLDALEFIDEKYRDPSMKVSLETMLDHFLRNQGSYIFSTSFCLISDQLSQWRGYGNKQGVCIEFDENKLHDVFKHLNYRITRGNVFYTAEGSTLEAREEINSFLDLNFYAQSFNRDKFRRDVYLHSILCALVPFFKHDGFKEEKEYRFIYTPFDKVPDIKFRISGDRLVPYITPSVCEGVKLPIKKIIIGPSKATEDVVSGVRFFLKHFGYQDVDVVLSQIPYRT